MTALEDIRLRAMRPADLDQIIPLERTLFGPGAWTQGMFREEIAAWGRWYTVAEQQRGAQNNTVAETAGKIVGYAGLWFDGEITQVMTISVAPNYQRQGIGEAMLSALIEQSTQLGANAIFLEVRIDNAPAIRLYEKFGFTEIAIRKRYYQPEDVDALVMRRDLTPYLDSGEVVG